MNFLKMLIIKAKSAHKNQTMNSPDRDARAIEVNNIPNLSMEGSVQHSWWDEGFGLALNDAAGNATKVHVGVGIHLFPNIISKSNL